MWFIHSFLMPQIYVSLHWDKHFCLHKIQCFACSHSASVVPGQGGAVPGARRTHNEHTVTAITTTVRLSKCSYPFLLPSIFSRKPLLMKVISGTCFDKYAWNVAKFSDIRNSCVHVVYIYISPLGIMCTYTNLCPWLVCHSSIPLLTPVPGRVGDTDV